MGKVIKADSLPHHKARIDHAKQTFDDAAKLQGKTWEELSEAEKWSIIQKLAVQAGLIKAS
jgi:hypothetical protein